MNDLLVSFSDVTIRYPEGPSFNHVSIDILKNEHLAVVGDNEALQNALLEALAGRANVISGRTTQPFFKEYVAANDITDPLISPSRLIATVSARHTFRNLSNTSEFYYQQRFNSSDSENSLTVQSYLSNVKTYSKNPQWTLEITIDHLHLQDLLDEELIKLSNGETKRVMIAAALLKNPVLLLLINPLTGLDVASRNEITRLIGLIAQSGITVIMSVSATEIPPAITKALVVKNDNTIIKMPVIDLPANIPAPTSHEVNVHEIKALLAIQKMPVFQHIVFMNNVSIRYGEHNILHNINWTIRQGERWALLGHNGAGKSTLLSLINGDNPQAFANDIVLFDRKKGTGESIWDIKKKIGFFSSELYQYFPVETSCLHAVESGFYDTIGLFRPSHPQTAGIALRWMKLLAIDQFANKLLRHVSVVHQRLCLLARALVKSPVLLILDEPCQGFNDSQREQFKGLINSICDVSNITMIYVSHYQEEIPRSVTKTLQLSKGKVVGQEHSN